MSDEDEIEKRKARRQEKVERATKMMDESKYPCLMEHDLSLKCLDKNNFKKELCSSYFLNYRNCMGFWDSVQTDRRRKGIRPLLPPPQERAEIRAKHLGKSNTVLS